MNAIEFSILGPYEIPAIHSEHGSNKRITKEDVKNFWESIDEDIACSQGCYVFALRSGGGIIPWYVGRTTNALKNEALKSYQIENYNDVLFNYIRGTPVLFFLIPERSKANKEQPIEELEVFLIQSALHKNPELYNRHKTKGPSWVIKGITKPKPGKPSSSEADFKTMMGL